MLYRNNKQDRRRNPLFITIALLIAFGLALVAPLSHPATAAALDKDALPDGSYVVNIAFIQMDRTTPSMADSSLASHSVALTVKDGKYYISLELNVIRFTISGITDNNYLQELNYYADGFTWNAQGAPQGATLPTTTLSYWTNQDGTPIVDNYNDANHPYPRNLEVPLVHKASDAGGMVPMTMLIPIMYKYQEDVQPVFLWVKWTTLRLPGDPDPTDVPTVPDDPTNPGDPNDPQNPGGSNNLAGDPNQNQQPSTDTPPVSTPLDTTTKPPVSEPAAEVTAFSGSLKTIYLKKGATLTLPFMVYGSLSSPVTLQVASSQPSVVSLLSPASSVVMLNAAANVKIKAVKAGSSTVTVTAANGQKLTCKVVVAAKATPVKKVTIGALPKKNSLKVGASRTLSVKTNAKATLSKTAVTWKSSNTKVISIDGAGKLTARAVGSARISVRVGGKMATVTLTVKK